MMTERGGRVDEPVVSLVEVERRGGALLLRLMGLDDKGMFTKPLLDELAGRIRRAPADPSVRAVILTGVGSRFCAGGNIGNALASRESFAAAFLDVLLALAESELPIIAVVNGQCTAGGMTLLGAADYAFTVPEAIFGYSELAVGAFPMLALVTMPSHLPKKTFFEWVYEAKHVSAAEMLERDLVNRVIEADQIWGAVDQFVSRLSEYSAPAIAKGRRLYYSTLGALRIDHMTAATQSVSALPAVEYYQEKKVP